MFDKDFCAVDMIGAFVIALMVGFGIAKTIDSGKFRDGYNEGERDTYRSMKLDAVAHGKAEWYIGVDGEITFRWKQ